MEISEMNYWGGVICGCCAASLFFVVMMFVSVEQTNRLRAEVAQLKEEVAGHEEVIKQYEFYVWHNMKFFEEKEE
jgi:hypothetical protein